MSAVPSPWLVGGVHESVALPEAVATTEMENAGSDAVTPPADALMTMSAYTPTCADVGVPLSSPLLGLSAAHDGTFVPLKVIALPALSVAVGLNE